MAKKYNRVDEMSREERIAFWENVDKCKREINTAELYRGREIFLTSLNLLEQVVKVKINPERKSELVYEVIISLRAVQAILEDYEKCYTANLLSKEYVSIGVPLKELSNNLINLAREYYHFYLEQIDD